MALSAEHTEKLKTKYGISPNDLNGVVSSLTADEASKLLAFRVDSGGILIRYPNSDAFSIRLDSPPTRDGKQLKYLRPRGQRNALFVPPAVDINKLDEIWITEGELKALAASQRGLPVVALSGIWNWRSGVDDSDPDVVAATFAAGGKAPDRAALIEDLDKNWTGKRFVLIYDSDITRDHEAWPAFGRLAEQLYARGAAEVKVLTLPAINPEGKTGIDDYLLLRRNEGHDAAAELKALVAQAPAWLPTQDGAEEYAKHLLKDPSPASVARAAAAVLAARGELAAKEITKKVSGDDMRRAVWKEARLILEQARKIQNPQERGHRNQRDTLGAIFEDAPEEVKALKIPAGWEITPEGLFLIKEVNTRWGAVESAELVSATPIILTSKKTDIDTGNENYVGVHFLLGGKWQGPVSVESVKLFDRNKIVSALRPFGVNISTGNASNLVAFLTAFEQSNRIPATKVATNCGFKQLGRELGFVLGPRIITQNTSIAGGATAEEVRDAQLLEFLGLTPGEKQLAEALGKRRGTEDCWIEGILKPLAPYPAFHVALYAALTPPVMYFAGGPNFVLDFAGRPGRGKSTAVKAAMSVWGNPGDKGLMLSWAATTVNLERSAAFANNLPLFVDETSLVSKHPEVLGRVVYQFVEGREKGRGSVDGLRASQSWRSVMVTTGEQELTKLLPGQFAGAKRRVLEWTDEVIPDSDLQKLINMRVERCHGHGGEEFVRYLLSLPTEDLEKMPELLLELDRSLKGVLEASGIEVNGITASYTTYVAMMALAGSLAHDVLPLPWSWEEGLESLKHLLIQAARLNEQEFTHQIAINHLASWINANAANFFNGPGFDPERVRELYGKWENGQYVAVFPHILERVLETKGLNPTALYPAWAEAGYIATEMDQGRRKFAVRIYLPDRGYIRAIKVFWHVIKDREGSDMTQT